MKQRIINLVGSSGLALAFSLGLLILPLTVIAAGGSVTQTTYADFSQSCTVLTGTIPTPVLTNTHVSAVASGTVTLAATFSDTFSSTLDSRWTTGIWGSGYGYTPTVSGGLLTLPATAVSGEGGWVRSTKTYTYGVIEALAEFGSGTFQHIGFGSNISGGGFAGDRFFIFSTFNTTNTLFARTNNNSSTQTINLGALPSGFHRYTIEWKPLDADTDRVIFFLDGQFKAEFNVVSNLSTGEARDFYFYLSNNDLGVLRVDQAQVEPDYVTSGTYTSCALDAGVGNGWQTISWDDVIPPSTSLAVEARVSNDGSTWSAWESVSDGGSVNANLLRRYAQYRLLLSTSNPQVSPLVNSVTLDFDALPGLSIVDNTSISESGPNGVFTVTLSASISDTVSVNYATANNTAVAPADYLTATGALTFTPGVTVQTITVGIQNDLIDEPNEKFLVNLSNPVNATIADSQAEGTINDNDSPPTANINNVAVTEGNSGTKNANFTVSLSSASGKTINVSYAMTNGTAIAPGDYLTATGTLTFTPGVTTQPITVVVNGDGVIEPNETFQVNLTTLVDVFPGVITGTGTITNDDTVGVAITQSGGNTNVVEGGATDTYQVKLTSQPAVTVTLTLTPNAQVSVGPGSLDFNALTWNTSQTVTVTAVDDAILENSPHSGVITHTTASDDLDYNNIPVANVTANITDNDGSKLYLPIVLK